MILVSTSVKKVSTGNLISEGYDVIQLEVLRMVGGTLLTSTPTENACTP